MSEPNEKVKALLEKLDHLQQKQHDFSQEIRELRQEIQRLSNPETPVFQEPEKIAEEPVANIQSPVTDTERPATPPPISSVESNVPPGSKSNLEKFIGENLINKIGIAITVLGVGIGAKYSIDHDLISPLTRILLGYLAGLVLVGVGLKLRRNYKNFSAVLVSGAFAIMYFITYVAFDFYQLMPQLLAFGLMIVFTGLAVGAAMGYNRQVIAHIGLVGAYGVPFLLSDGTGEASVLFSYMAIINVGILIISFRKYWKALYYAAFGLTWIMFISWWLVDYQRSESFAVALIFLMVFFVIFYLTFLAYKLIRKEEFERDDIALLLLNSFVFYGVGYALLNDHHAASKFCGLFTLCNAAVHFAACGVFYKRKNADENLFYLLAGLVLVFITIAIPVQLDGHWVTLLWAGEAAVLFWIGRTRGVITYEKLSYPLMALAFFSLVHDWSTVYGTYNPAIAETRITPIFNVHFLISVLFLFMFGVIHVVNRNPDYSPSFANRSRQIKIIALSLGAVLIFSAYFSFLMEIKTYWNQLYADSTFPGTPGSAPSNGAEKAFDISQFQSIWLINYSLLFFGLLSMANVKKWKSEELGLASVGLITLCIGIFLFEGLFAMGELRESYLQQSMTDTYQRGVFHLGIRYVSFAFVALALMGFYRHIRQQQANTEHLKVPFDILVHLTLVWIASSEMIHWLEIANSAQSNKLGISILWGVYSLFLIGFGIRRKKKHLRIGAIVLFGVTLLKLFFYDISHLNTIAKTIVFVSLGVLLLVISFLYNKFRDVIAEGQ